MSAYVFLYGCLSVQENDAEGKKGVERKDQLISKSMDIGAMVREREKKVLFNDALNTFYIRLYGVRSF